MSHETHQIDISVETVYVEKQSTPENNRYVFAYTVTICNKGSVDAQLISRHWIITDAAEHIQEVRGEGVVGEKPFINPGSNFEYQSYCPLETSFGCMKGFYMMKDECGNCFKIPIPNLGLVSSDQIN